MGDLEPIAFPGGRNSSKPSGSKVTFDRRELMRILDLYGRKAVMGALRLYLDFINLFMMLLQLFGRRD